MAYGDSTQTDDNIWNQQISQEGGGSNLGGLGQFGGNMPNWMQSLLGNNQEEEIPDWMQNKTDPRSPYYDPEYANNPDNRMFPEYAQGDAQGGGMRSGAAGIMGGMGGLGGLLKYLNLGKSGDNRESYVPSWRQQDNNVNVPQVEKEMYVPSWRR